MEPLNQLLISQPDFSSVATSTAALVGAVVSPYVQVSDYFIQTNMYMTAGAIYLLPVFLKQLPIFKTLMGKSWVVRFMPIYPLVAAFLSTYLPGALTLPDSLFGTRLVATMWLAGLSMVMHKVIGQTILGHDSRLKAPMIGTPEPDGK